MRRLDLDSKGRVWFVNSTLGKIGRLDPSTGAIKQWDSPSGSSSHPYALAIIDDVIWYNESGMRPDALVRFNPESESFQSWGDSIGCWYRTKRMENRSGKPTDSSKQLESNRFSENNYHQQDIAFILTRLRVRGVPRLDS